MQQFLATGNQNHLTNLNTEVPYEIIRLIEGETLFREGDAPQGLYYVQAGCLKLMVHREMARGRTTTAEYLTKLVSPGEYFGYKGLVRGGTHRGTAQAVQSSEVWLYPKDTVQTALKGASPLVKFLMRQAVTDLDSYEKISQLHYLASVHERIAYQLVLLAEKFGKPTEAGISLNLKLTRNEFAQLASTINESLSRHLTELKSEGLIDVNGKEIIIKDLNALKLKSGNF